MQTITVRSRLGPVPCDAYYVRHGLAVTKVLDNPHRWHVTHVASGKSLDDTFTQRQRAKAYQEALLATDIDWTQGDDALRRLCGFQRTLRRLLETCPR